MKKWIFAFIIIFFILLIAYCGRVENKLTVQEKRGNDTYQFIAYKEKVDEENAKAIRMELKKGDWKTSKIKLKKNPSDYIFYFNEDKEEGTNSVYHVWLKDDPMRVTVYSGEKEMKLEGKEAKRLIENVLDVEFHQ